MLLLVNDLLARAYKSVVQPRVAVWQSKAVEAITASDEQTFDGIERQFASMLRFDPTEDQVK